MAENLTSSNQGAVTDARARVRRPLARLVQCLLSLGFFSITEISRALRKLLGLPVPASATVIYYHQVPPTDRRRFARQMDHLLRWAVPVRADTGNPGPPGSRSVAVTFDDGWSSFLENALPELKSRSIPVTMFMISGRMGCKIEDDPSERLMSAAELQSLDPKLVTIGSHTVSHCRLTGVDENEARHQLSESRHTLERLLGREVKLFSFPFTIYNERLLELCRQTGYARAFTGMPHLAFKRADEFETGRVRVDPTDSMLEFHLKILGAYRWMPMAIAGKRRLLARMRAATAVFRAPSPNQASRAEQSQ
jgi:peptidoglycan/xylan/chitin deacetylase (PgdA/CDA1 family)